MFSINNKLKQTNEKQKKLLSWFSKQNDELKMKVLKEKKNQFFLYKQSNKELKYEELDYIALIAAINIIYEKLDYINKKNKSKSLDEISEISTLELASLKKSKSSHKYDAILNKISIVSRLRETGFSWRNISKYLKIKYRLVVSHAYLRKVYEEVTSNAD